MSVKILGGLAKGMNLFVPKGDKIRPTSVMLKRKLFDSTQNLKIDCFLDTCAGTGAIGLEAWSRGAEKVFLVENDRIVLLPLKKNLEKIQERFGDEVEEREIKLIGKSLNVWFEYFKKSYLLEKEEWRNSTVIFFDPPYDFHDMYKKWLVKNILEDGWFTGQLWVESDEKKGVPSSFWDQFGLKDSRLITQGDSYILLVKF